MLRLKASDGLMCFTNRATGVSLLSSLQVTDISAIRFPFLCVSVSFYSYLLSIYYSSPIAGLILFANKYGE